MTDLRARGSRSALAVRLYRGLLLLYPREFRRAYGAEMLQLFCDTLSDPGESAFSFWRRVLIDTLVAGLKERSEQMKRGTLAMIGAAICVGLAIAWVDSRPHWDDTGITAGALLLSSAIFGAASPGKPWLWALSIGIWIPLAAAIRGANYSMFLILLFTFAGAYIGSTLRRAVAPPAAPTADRP